MVGQYNNNNNCYRPLILIKLPFLFKKMENVGLFREFNSTLQNGCQQLLYFSLFWLAHGLYFGDSRLPSNKCYQRGRFTLGQRCPLTHKESPGVELTFSTEVYSFLDSLLRVSQSLLNSFLFLGKLHWFPSLGQSYFYEPSVFTLRYVGDRISWKTWCWNEKDGG